MNLKTSCSSIDRVMPTSVIINNMKRLWPIAILSFLVQFLSTSFPLMMMNGNNYADMVWYVEELVEFFNFFVMFTLFLTPVLSATFVFQYLYSSSSVSVIHSMPFNRSGLFMSSLKSGFLLSTMPIILNGLLLLGICAPIYNINPNNPFTYMNIIGFIGYSILVTIFVYSISVFAAILAGTTAIQLLLSFVFNFIVYGLYLALHALLSLDLFGYSDVMTTIEKFSPVIYLPLNKGTMPFSLVLMYLAISFAILGISFLLYKIRHLEKANDSLVFKKSGPILCYLLSFFTMVGMGFFFYALESSRTFLYMGYVSGIILGILIGNMIIEKSVKIFNKTTLKYVVSFSLISAALILGISTDIVGFENKVPSADDVAYVRISDSSSNQHDRVREGLNYTDYLLGPGDERRDNYGNYYSEETIKGIIATHQYIVDNKDYIQEYLYNGSEYDNYRGSFFHVDFYYTLENGRELNRSYMLPVDIIDQNVLLGNYMSTEEYNSDLAITQIGPSYIKKATIEGSFDTFEDDYDFNADIINDPEKVYELILAINEDYKVMTPEDHVENYKKNSIVLVIDYKKTSSGYKDNDFYYDYKDLTVDDSRDYYVRIYANSKNSIDWLKENGYSHTVSHF